MTRFTIVFLAFFCCGSRVWSMGEEHLGNDPVNGANYASNEGILPVLNDTHRVYRWWVNGNEKFFFRGDTIALNAALEAFSKVKSKKLEVVLRPGPTSTGTFHGDKKVAYNWHLHLIGGIVGHMSKNDLGGNVWPTHPMMYVYVGGEIQLSDLEIPDNVTVLQLSDLHKRYAAALASTDQTVRGWTCGVLAELNRYDPGAISKVADMLDDDVSWVRLNAAGALATFGSKATTILPKLESALVAAEASEDENLTKRIKETIEKIRSAKNEASEEDQFEKMKNVIATYCADRG